jgi:hypothetical protein
MNVLKHLDLTENVAFLPYVPTDQEAMNADVHREQQEILSLDAQLLFSAEKTVPAEETLYVLPEINVIVLIPTLGMNANIHVMIFSAETMLHVS